MIKLKNSVALTHFCNTWRVQSSKDNVFFLTKQSSETTQDISFKRLNAKYFRMNGIFRNGLILSIYRSRQGLLLIVIFFNFVFFLQLFTQYKTKKSKVTGLCCCIWITVEDCSSSSSIYRRCSSSSSSSKHSFISRDKM